MNKINHRNKNKQPLHARHRNSLLVPTILHLYISYVFPFWHLSFDDNKQDNFGVSDIFI